MEEAASSPAGVQRVGPPVDAGNDDASTRDVGTDDEALCLPDYGGANVCSLVPALLGPSAHLPGWMPASMAGGGPAVLVVLDGLGWRQLATRRHLAPTLASLEGGPATTVAPTTTATALTSIALGVTPGEHGIIGYRMDVDGVVLNVLRWDTPDGDARRALPPDEVQGIRPFLGQRVPVVTRAELGNSGFSSAHLAGTTHVGYRTTATLVVQTAKLVRSGERFVYAYYDGVDKVAHEYGLAEEYDAEVRAADRLVADLLEALPSGTAVLVTADHGQVHVGDSVHPPAPEVLALVDRQSGEGRFRWLHARSGAGADLAAAAAEAHGHEAWVVTQEQVVSEGWLGPHVSEAARRRLGDVALVPHQPMAFADPADSGPYHLVSRHGSVTAAETLVPLLAART